MPTAPPIGRPPAPAALFVAAGAAACGPSLLAYNVAPSPTFLNQALALVLWGAFVAVAALHATPASALRRASAEAALPLAALGLLLVAAAGSWGFGSLPSGLALSSVGMLLAAALLVLSGAAARGGAQPLLPFVAFCAGWVMAGLLGSAIGSVQVFAPDWPDGDWVARSGLAGRAVGNLRQPNHLSSLLLWAAIAVVPLAEVGQLRRRVAWALFAVMVFGVVLTASRTGVLGVGLLALWGAFDRRLAPRTRAMLLASPLLYLAAWLGLAAWAEFGRHAFGGEGRLAEADLSGSRFGIWSDTLGLIARQPWLGVGFGEFNLAWSLTPFPHRPTAFFDHAHDLPLHLAAEIGVPLALAVLGLLGVGLWRALHLPADVPADDAVAQRSAGVMLLLIALHSLLEYPLWYAYFLLPAAWMFGYALGRPARGPPNAAPPVGAAAARPAAGGAGAGGSGLPAPAARGGASPGSGALFAAGLLLSFAGALSVVDYLSVVRIFAPSATSPLAERIAAGRRSWLFAHHADYAAVTTPEVPPTAPPAFRDAPHYLLDTRLMIAWAKALAARGELDRARHIAARLREFRNPGADEFFAPCLDGAEPRPFQCDPPGREPDWREFVR